jgi:UPF0271 protein
MKIDLNCDLGEGEPHEKTEALMHCISSANIACGGHAGDERTIATTLELAKKYHVHAGGHPGLPDRATFGRSEADLTSKEFEELLEDQIETLYAAAKKAALALHHIKLHGALYHLTEKNEELRASYIQTVKTRWPNLIIFALAGGQVISVAEQAGLQTWPEAFLDRNYLDHGSLVPRASPDAVITDLSEIERRLSSIVESGTILTARGTRLSLSPKTLCIHSDSPLSVEIAMLAKRCLES